ncbi:hypothetical protein BDZ94DRAFT_1270668 [Collybia nuda]|uniref:Uncharacterized protein n=1 Tax=Collybia nuda TaxID=64659 RepID=A0A9P6CEX3_9AGAR|nr:hypothetical protein BDZ94DRAFT_1270668 [Collybia nuda]
MNHELPITEPQFPLVVALQRLLQSANPHDLYRSRDIRNTPQPPERASSPNDSGNGERSANAYAILFALFSAVQVQLLSSIPTDSGASQSTITMFYIISYAGLILNLIASLTAIFYIHISNAPVGAQGNTHMIKKTILPKLRSTYETAAILGTPLILAQILLHALAAQRLPVSVILVITVMTCLVLVPMRLYTTWVTRLAPGQEGWGGT